MEHKTDAKKKIEGLREKISQFREAIADLVEQHEREVGEFTSVKVAEGLGVLTLRISYEGWEGRPAFGRSVRGDPNTFLRTFLFAPGVDSARWERAHFAVQDDRGSQDYEAFENWLDGLAEDQFIEVE